MSIRCGSQVILCDYPIRLDNYEGCSHQCEYCFVKRKFDISKLKSLNKCNSLINFIKGERNKDCSFASFKIPLHWGGMSDPFQPLELRSRSSKALLEIFRESKYPFIVSTKGVNVMREYLPIIKECRAVVQVSMVSPKLDKFEKGAPSYQDRMDSLKEISENCTRLVVRVQPYMTQLFGDVINSFKKMAENGVHGVVVEGMKFFSKQPGTVKWYGDCVYPEPILRKHFGILKDEAHKQGLKFYSGENRLRSIGDSPSCCGAADLPDFPPHTMNLNGPNRKHNNGYSVNGTANCMHSLQQDAISGRQFAKMSFEEAFDLVKKSSMNKMVG